MLIYIYIYYRLCAALLDGSWSLGFPANRFMQNKWYQVLVQSVLHALHRCQFTIMSPLWKLLVLYYVILKIYLRVVGKVMRNLCGAVYVAFLAEDSTACFQLDGIPAFGYFTNMGEKVKSKP